MFQESHQKFTQVNKKQSPSHYHFTARQRLQHNHALEWRDQLPTLAQCTLGNKQLSYNTLLQGMSENHWSKRSLNFAELQITNPMPQTNETQTVYHSKKVKLVSYPTRALAMACGDAYIPISADYSQSKLWYPFKVGQTYEPAEQNTEYAGI